MLRKFTDPSGETFPMPLTWGKVSPCPLSTPRHPGPIRLLGSSWDLHPPCGLSPIYPHNPRPHSTLPGAPFMPQSNQKQQTMGSSGI